MSESQMIAEPDWLAAEPSARAKLTAIMAAVRAHYTVSGPPSDCGRPRITPAVAEVLIGQLLIVAAGDGDLTLAGAYMEGVRAERQRIADLAREVGARYDETKPCSCGRTRPDGSPCVELVRPGVPFADLLREES